MRALDYNRRAQSCVSPISAAIIPRGLRASHIHLSTVHATVLGDRHRSTLTSVLNVAELLADQGRLE